MLFYKEITYLSTTPAEVAGKHELNQAANECTVVGGTKTKFVNTEGLSLLQRVDYIWNRIGHLEEALKVSLIF